jgi:hypothetical protein
MLISVIFTYPVKFLQNNALSLQFACIYRTFLPIMEVIRAYPGYPRYTKQKTPRQEFKLCVKKFT